MFETRKWLATAAVAFVSMASAPMASANLVVNGGFEADVVAGGTYNYVSTGSLTGWTVFSPAPHHGAVLFDATYKPVSSGVNALQIEYVGDYIEQTLNTVAGQLYSLVFDLASYLPPGVSSLQVEIGSNPALQFSNAGTGNYTTHSVQFTATSASTLLQFESIAVPGVTGFTYPHLDNISVTAVPEPGALALVGAALLGAAAARRRKPG